jgi:hypothetical protein
MIKIQIADFAIRCYIATFYPFPYLMPAAPSQALALLKDNKGNGRVLKKFAQLS